MAMFCFGHNWGRWAGLGAALLMVGCGAKEEIKTFQADNNGYLCMACKTKFYTAADVYADFCPQCKGMNIQQVVGYVCPDGHTTVETRNRGAIKCGQCGKTTTGVKLPGESEYQAWGAAKKAKSAVCQ